MDALRLFWFFEPQIALWGLELGTPPMGLLFGPLLGGGYGTIAGLALGTMEGAILWAITLLFHRRIKPGDTSQYLRVAGGVCAGAYVLASASLFEIVARAEGASLVNGVYGRAEDMIMLTIVLLIPTIIAASAV